jgi:hypothetical protein
MSESKQAFEKYADQYDNLGDDWQDKSAGAHFIAGFQAGQDQAENVPAHLVEGVLADARRYRWLKFNNHLGAWWSAGGPADKFLDIDQDIDTAEQEGA